MTPYRRLSDLLRCRRRISKNHDVILPVSICPWVRSIHGRGKKSRGVVVAPPLGGAIITSLRPMGGRRGDRCARHLVIGELLRPRGRIFCDAGRVHRNFQRGCPGPKIRLGGEVERSSHEADDRPRHWEPWSRDGG
ncbi:hypothetical protein JTE90_021233 [Oedothorax gibbosus]|uniref:Uncharacterized protein n=1 Tax=Oedothorax gibbosus TaxID=931172 RepID=A0AAV6UUS1_9ARAC|nr:hypothetical protein JTE90_021233 [Oedothorax gibbosus]